MLPRDHKRHRRQTSDFKAQFDRVIVDVVMVVILMWLVITTVQEDKGVPAKLTPYRLDEPAVMRVASKDCLTIVIDSLNNIDIEGHRIREATVYDWIDQHIGYPRALPTAITVRYERATSFETYLTVYDALLRVYHEHQTELSWRLFGEPYSQDIPFAHRKEINAKLPVFYAESMPYWMGKDSVESTVTVPLSFFMMTGR